MSKTETTLERNTNNAIIELIRLLILRNGRMFNPLDIHDSAFGKRYNIQTIGIGTKTENPSGYVLTLTTDQNEQYELQHLHYLSYNDYVSLLNAVLNTLN